MLVSLAHARDAGAPGSQKQRLGMERRTVASYQPEMADLPGVPASALSRAGYDVFSLAQADARRLGAALGGTAPQAAVWIERARLATLAGIGTENAKRLLAAGISSVADLAAADPDGVRARLVADGGPEIPDRRLRLWIHRARQGEEAAGRVFSRP